MEKNVWATGLTLGALGGLFVLMGLNAKGYLHTPEDLLFYDRILVMALVLWRLRWTVWRQKTTFFFRSRIPGSAFLGIVPLFLTACITATRTVSVYLTLLYAAGLIWATRGRGTLRRVAPFLCAVAVMAYPPRQVLEVLTSWSQSFCFAVTQRICAYLLPEARFAESEVIVGDIVIGFDPECGGFHLVCTMVALALVLGAKVLAGTVLVKVLFLAGVLALGLNIARVVSILALTVLGYAEEALFDIHYEIGHGFAFLGTLATVGLVRWGQNRTTTRSQIVSS